MLTPPLRVIRCCRYCAEEETVSATTTRKSAAGTVSLANMTVGFAGASLGKNKDKHLVADTAAGLDAACRSEFSEMITTNKTNYSVGGSCTPEGIIVESSSETELSSKKAGSSLQCAGPGLPLDGWQSDVNLPSMNESREVANAWNEEHGIQNGAASQQNSGYTVRLDDGDCAGHSNIFAILSSAVRFMASILASVLAHKLAVPSSSRSCCKAGFQWQRHCLPLLVCVGLLLCSTTANSNNTFLHSRKLSSVTVSSFKQLRDLVANAPTNGAETIFDIEGDQMEWTTGDGQDDTDSNRGSIVVVNYGANVLIRGSDDQTRTILDAKASDSSRRRFFDIKEGATLEISNLRLQNGYVASD